VHHPDDWFRQAALTQTAISAFELKLKRSRSSRHEYMRIQAGALYSVGAYENAITMVDRIIAEDPNHFGLAWLYESKAQCYRKEGQIEEAVRFYRLSIERTRDRPSVVGQAQLDFPFWVASAQLTYLYEEALNTTNEFFQPHDIFPIDTFKRFATLALILADTGHDEDARPPAITALAAAARTTSNAANHRNLGIVDQKFDDIRKRLESIAQGSVFPPFGVGAKQLLNHLLKRLRGK
jgi:tetratricopeptide (TPR) repeat protein